MPSISTKKSKNQYFSCSTGMKLRVLLEFLIRKTESIPKSLYTVLLLLSMVVENASDKEVVTSITEANLQYFRL